MPITIHFTSELWQVAGYRQSVGSVDYNAVQRFLNIKIRNALHKRLTCGLHETSNYSVQTSTLNPLDPRGNHSATSNTMKLVHWPLMGGLLHLVQRGGAWVGWGPAQSPPRCTKCSSPPINGQCTNFILFDVALWLPLGSKGLTICILYTFLLP